MDVKGYEGLYTISETGEIRNKCGKIIQARINNQTKSKRSRVSLSKKQKRKEMYVDKLIYIHYPHLSDVPVVDEINTKYIIGSPNYIITTTGDIFSLISHKYLHLNIGKNGYVTTCIDSQKRIYLHRLLALHFIPNPNNLPMIDHRNGIRTDNKLKNLRWVTRSQNCHNTSISRNNTSGITGVGYNKSAQKWSATMEINGKKLYKLCDTKEEAILHRKEWEDEVGDYFRN
tara:strand:- start:1732 stop:2421 length:690 start_codon:yes stop_codon:yes gene_type:complete